MKEAGADFLEVPYTAAQRHAFYIKNLTMIMQYTAVFVVSDTYAIELMHFLQERGIRIPKNISIVGFDNMGLCEPVALQSLLQSSFSMVDQVMIG